MFRTDPPLVPIVDKPDLWWLEQPLVWSDDARTITIPAGFITDDASIPKVFDWIPALDRQGLSRRPGLLHDGLYSLGREYGKDFADHMLFVSCCAEGVSPGWASAIWWGVHLGGQSGWDQDAVAAIQISRQGSFIDKEHFLAWMATGGTIFGPARKTLFA